MTPRQPATWPSAGVAAALAGLASLRIPAGWALPAFWALAGVSIALAAIDVRTQRLPNALVLPAYPLLLALLGAATLIQGDVTPLLRGLVGAAALLVVFAGLHAARPSGLGAGDVKLAGLLGLALGWLSWDALITGAAAGLVVGAIVGCVVLVRRGRTATFAYGPSMLLGAWLALLA